MLLAKYVRGTQCCIPARVLGEPVRARDAAGSVGRSSPGLLASQRPQTLAPVLRAAGGHGARGSIKDFRQALGGSRYGSIDRAIKGAHLGLDTSDQGQARRLRGLCHV
jgi:hypothetical protein